MQLPSQYSNRQTNKQPILSVLIESHSEKRQSGEFFLLQWVGSGGGGGVCVAGEEVNNSLEM